MTITKLQLENSNFRPGEVLNHKRNEWTHITITYNVSGDRSRVDQNIDAAMENDDDLVKVDYVNTTLYIQMKIRADEDESLEQQAEIKVREKMREIFVGDYGLGGSTVSVFCMVGNLRAFAYKFT
ncbi:hypothetical protein [Vibrio sp. 16]|uniref:hypothetical protein n=1 Tax=Vibrio sp. 16 TaxID=391586 RepID=UPI00018F3B4C|nr:hypothetical protein [Vibrio sp. 16]EED26816.1 hypothetical protein VPMS16_2136 [Vibrio sp. 16]CAK4074063.1 hypothetical protein VDT1_3188 [Vibrio sp. 16]